MTQVVGVATTGIYCLPGACSGRPNRENTRRYGSAAAAEAEGLRACHLCRPYRQEPLSSWIGSEFICRAIQRILDGALHGGTEAELAEDLGVSARHLRRRFLDEVGTTPVQLARSSRAHYARRLLDDTDLSITEVAFAAGFGSVRQFNRTMTDIFSETPRRLRSRRRARDRLAADGGLSLRLPVVQPVDVPAMMKTLESEAIGGVESVADGWYRRTIAVEGDPGVLEIGSGSDHLVARIHLPHWEGLIHHVRRARRVFRLNGDHAHMSVSTGEAVCATSDQPTAVPGTWDPFEVGVRAVLARAERCPDNAIQALVERFGSSVPGLQQWGLTHLFPDAGTLVRADLASLALGPEAEGLLKSLAREMREVSDSNRPLERRQGLRLGADSVLPGWLVGDILRRLPGRSGLEATWSDPTR